MLVQRYLRRPAGGAGGFAIGSNQSTSNDSQQHKQLISIQTKNATASWLQNSFPTLAEARAIYTDVQVLFETHKLPIVKYDDL